MISEMWRPIACSALWPNSRSRTGVPAADRAVERLADDGIVRRFDDGRQQARRHQLVRPL
jgi:hypothetical protein